MTNCPDEDAPADANRCPDRATGAQRSSTTLSNTTLGTTRGGLAVGNDGAASEAPDQGDDVPDGYANLARIARGGYAVVYRALDLRFDRDVALKILSSDSLDDRLLRRFNAECMATGRVSSHPNIVTVYDAGTTRGNRPWLAMEYCSGGSLAHRVATGGPLAVAEVVTIGARLGSALSAAHQGGILHRDVKPHNVLLTAYGEPALADFGIASLVVGGEAVAQTGAYTVVHAAPEILQGKPATEAADLYSLGSTLYTLLAGQAPFAAEARTGLAPLIARILANEVPDLARRVPPELEHLLRRAMAAQPQDRPSAAELCAALAALGPQLGVAGDLGRQLATAEPGEPAERVTSRRAIQGSRTHPAPAAPAPAATAPVAPNPDAQNPDARNRPAGNPRARRPRAGRVLLTLGALLGVLLATFTGLADYLEPASPEPGPRSPAVTANAPNGTAGYAPAQVVVRQGAHRGELIVSWTRPSPEVVATVIYEGSGAARAMVSYDGPALPQVTLRGLPRRHVCLSAVHLVSVSDKVTNAASPPVCAVPR